MAPSAPVELLHLPGELLGLISTFSANRDIKNLRLTCRLLHSTARLRLSRVFLSSNYLNIEVFRAIADHETFRKQIVEIIWDETRMRVAWRGSRITSTTPGLGYTADNCPLWFADACELNLLVNRHFRGEDAGHPDHVARDQPVVEPLPLRQCWAYYQELQYQERDVRVSGDDCDVFQYGLKRFPSLRRVTITPAAHGFLSTPMYETPMIRAFPQGFNYPIPRSWHFRNMDLRPMTLRWIDLNESSEHTWRGFRFTLKALAKIQRHGIVELVVDVNHLLHGIKLKQLAEPVIWQYLLAVLRRPGFRRLDLAITVEAHIRSERSRFRNRYMRRTLAVASDLEHMSLRACEAIKHICSDDHHDRYFIPLRTIFPIREWSRLRHFGLSHLMVRQGDLLRFLAALPATIRSVELSCLHFVQGTYRDLLEDVRDTLGWRDRGTSERPRVTIGIATEYGSERNIWVDRKVEAFIYQDGPNPFQGADGCKVARGMGVVRDAFDPDYERPN